MTKNQSYICSAILSISFCGLFCAGVVGFANAQTVDIPEEQVFEFLSEEEYIPPSPEPEPEPAVEEQIVEPVAEEYVEPVYYEEPIVEEPVYYEPVISEPVYYEEPVVQESTEYIGNDFQSDGRWNDGTYDYTWYSSNVLYHYQTPEWTAGDDGIYRDSEGYVVVASGSLPYGTVVEETPFGAAKVYDSGCDSDTLDVYVNW